MTAPPTVAIAYHSGYGHTAVLAEAVRQGVVEAGGAATMVRVAAMTDAQWSTLDDADVIIFGSPTYMGTASGVFHAFAESTSDRWLARAWRDKLAAGFTCSAAMNGDKLHTLQYFTILAAQHGMLWINLDLLPGWNSSTGSEHDLNRIGIALGAGAQANNDQGAEAVTKADTETARYLGHRVVEVATRFSPQRITRG
jgi:NAD(P)H dehydrogenase (quinone)